MCLEALNICIIFAQNRRFPGKRFETDIVLQEKGTDVMHND